MNNKEVASKLITARGSKQQKAAAKELGITQSALAMYESGERMPRDEIKERIAAYYGTTVGALFFNEKVYTA